MSKEVSKGGKKAGPKVTRLGLHFASLRAIPQGGGVVDGIRWFRDPARMKQDLAKGLEDAYAAVAAVKAAPDNPYGDDDERIAEEILRRVDERRQQQREKGAG